MFLNLIIVFAGKEAMYPMFLKAGTASSNSSRSSVATTRPFKCNGCTRKWARKSDLLQHLNHTPLHRSLTTPQRPEQCRTCHLTFVTQVHTLANPANHVLQLRHHLENFKATKERFGMIVSTANGDDVSVGRTQSPQPLSVLRHFVYFDVSLVGDNIHVAWLDTQRAGHEQRGVDLA